jgi:hypothetical protein
MPSILSFLKEGWGPMVRAFGFSNLKFEISNPQFQIPNALTPDL